MCENKKVYLTEEEVAARLPHKGDSNFLGEAIVEPGVSATATLRKIPILAKSRQKTVPQFIMLDGMAQVIILTQPPEENTIGVLTGINRTRIRRPALISETVVFTADKIRKRPPFGKAHVAAQVGEETICEGELSFSIVSQDVFKNRH